MEPGPEVVVDPMGPNSTASGLSSVNSRLFAYAAALQKRGHTITIAAPEDLRQVAPVPPRSLCVARREVRLLVRCCWCSLCYFSQECPASCRCNSIRLTVFALRRYQCNIVRIFLIEAAC